MTHIEAIEPRRHFSAVSLDASFGTAGVASLRNGIPAKYATADTEPTSVVVDSAGRAIVMSVSYDRPPGNGVFRTLTSAVMTRLLPDGRPDPRFAVATGGSIKFDGHVPKVVVDSQNRIYVRDGDVTRYTASGKIDRTFGTRGTVDFIRLTGDMDVYATDFTIGGGDILWASLTYISENSTGSEVVRLTPDGQDIADGTGVSYATVTPGDVQYQYDSVGSGVLKTLTDGSVIAVTHFNVGIDPAANTEDGEVYESGVVVQKFQSSGKPDRAYGKRGRAVVREIWKAADSTVDRNGYLIGGDVTTVDIADDGTVLLRDQPLGGKARNVVVTPAGRSGGLATVGPRVTNGQILTQSDGRKLVLDTDAKTLRRYKADGTIDATFNNGLPVNGVSTMAFGPAGTLLTADTGRDATDTRYVVRRIEL